MRPTIPVPSTDAALVRVLLRHLPVSLIANLGGYETHQVERCAALVTPLAAPLNADRDDDRAHARQRLGGDPPRLRLAAPWLMRLRVIYEAVELVSAGGRDAESWLRSDPSLAAFGCDDSPLSLLRWPPLKDAAKMVLKAARLVSGGDFEPMQWPTRTLVTLDVDGVLLPMQEWAAEIRVEDFEELTFWQPPLAKPGTFYVDPEALAAVRRWCDLPDADVQWHTSWQEFVHLLAPALGLPPLPLFDYRTNFDVYRNRPWKHFALDVFAGDIPGVRCGGYSQLTIAT